MNKQKDIMYKFKATILDYIREHGLSLEYVNEAFEDIKWFMVKNAALEKLTKKEDEN